MRHGLSGFTGFPILWLRLTDRQGQAADAVVSAFQASLSVGKNSGGRRTLVACSKAKAILISVGSLQRRPMKVTPTGSSPKAYPAGTVTSGYPAKAAGVELAMEPRSPLTISMAQAGLRVGAKSASSSKRSMT